MEDSLKKELFENDTNDNHLTCLTEISSNTNPKMTADRCVFQFLSRSVDGKHLMSFQKLPFSNSFGASGVVLAGPKITNYKNFFCVGHDKKSDHRAECCDIH